MTASALAVLLAWGVAGTAAEPPPGPGSPDPFRPPDAKAVELNAAGKVPYRQGKWDEARALYRAAIAADPGFLAPRLNIASSFVRQDRFGEATAEVVALLDKAYVPWAREILDAADLGALKVRPEMKEIERAMAASAARWGEGLQDSLIFVARQRPPLRIPDGPGVFVLNQRQELWAYSPRTQRYRQLTAEDGHVVAMARSRDGRRVLYVTAEKLVRGPKPGDVKLRTVAFRELTLATMSLTPPAKFGEDVYRVRIDGDLYISVQFGTLGMGLGEDLHQVRIFELRSNGTLEPPDDMPRRPTVVTLTSAGVAPAALERFGSGYVARALRREGAPPTLEVGPLKGKLAPIKAGQGAGLGGLPIP